MEYLSLLYQIEKVNLSVHFGMGFNRRWVPNCVWVQLFTPRQMDSPKELSKPLKIWYELAPYITLEVGILTYLWWSLPRIAVIILASAWLPAKLYMADVVER